MAKFHCESSRKAEIIDFAAPLLHDLQDLLGLFEEPQVSLLESGTVRIALRADSVALPLKSVSEIARISGGYGWDGRTFGSEGSVIILLDRVIDG
jgi:hypothetical protein